MGLWPNRGDERRCHPEPFAVTLSEAKGLQFHSEAKMQILRFAQNDRLSGERV